MKLQIKTHLNYLTLGGAEENVDANGFVGLGEINDLAELGLSLGQNCANVQDVQG